MRLLLAFTALLFALPATAATYYVDSEIDAVDVVPGDGVCATSTGTCTLRAAIQETNALPGADRITVPAGHYVLALAGLPEEDTPATGDLDITDTLTLAGAGAEDTILDAAGIDRVLEVQSGDSVEISGVTVTGGSPVPVPCSGLVCLPVLGGGILNTVVPLTIRDSVISGNAGGLGGGVAVLASDLRLVRVDVSANEAADGGALWGVVGGTIEIVNSTISGNTTDCYCGSWDCRECRAAAVSGGDLQIFHSTVADNRAPDSISRSYAVYGIMGSEVTLVHSIVANPAVNGFDCYLPVTSGGHNIDSDGSCNLTDPTDLPNTDPLLGPLQDNGGPTWTHALLPGSPAIDAIPPADCTWDDDGDPATPEVPLTADQRGVVRPQGAGCDIGAYEVTACADGINNDGDAFIDAADPGCRDAASVREDPQCQDGINNDPAQDELIDFDGGLSALGYVATEPDPQCIQNPWKNNEFRQPSCGLGAELALLLPPLMWVWRRRWA